MGRVVAWDSSLILGDPFFLATATIAIVGAMKHTKAKLPDWLGYCVYCIYRRQRHV